KETDSSARMRLFEGLTLVAGRLEPADAARLLAQVLEKETDPSACSCLATALASVSRPLEPTEAAHICGAAAHSLMHTLEIPIPMGNREKLAKGLVAVVGRLEAAEAARLLALALEKETDPWGRCTLAKGLASSASHLELAEAARVYGAAARLLTQELEKQT